MLTATPMQDFKFKAADALFGAMEQMLETSIFIVTKQTFSELTTR
jgi:hypothetical protein